MTSHTGKKSTATIAFICLTLQSCIVRTIIPCVSVASAYSPTRLSISENLLTRARYQTTHDTFKNRFQHDFLPASSVLFYNEREKDSTDSREDQQLLAKTQKKEEQLSLSRTKDDDGAAENKKGEDDATPALENDDTLPNPRATDDDSSSDNKSSESVGPPPLQVEDTSVLFYDIFLLLNLSLSVSFYVVHRMSFFHIGSAISEGSLLCILWIAAGLFNGAFLHSAVDGHYADNKENAPGGPKAAGMLGLSTFVTVANLRILIALGTALVEHRPVGIGSGEQMIPVEIGFGLVLMSLWRALHSNYVVRR